MHDSLTILSKTSLRLLLTVIITFSLLVLFHISLEKLLDVTIVPWLLSNVDSTWYNDVIVGSAMILFVCTTYLKKDSYFPDKVLFPYLFAVNIFYLIYRIVTDHWIFTPFHYLSFLCYADILVLTTVLYGLLLLKKQKPKLSKERGYGFLDDKPIGEKGKDKLGYTSYASVIAQKMVESDLDVAFAIGVNGKWGYGKSSFMDLLKRFTAPAVRSGEVIEMNFDPWNSYSSKAIIRDFFDNVEEALRPHHVNLAKLLKKYADKLVELNDNSIASTVQASVTIFSSGSSLNSLFNSINTALKEINCKLIIYVDDLDRLDKEEIVEVIRLVRNTANFHNTIFVVGYDRGYLTRALKDHNPYNHEHFLEKIFQLEINLPYFRQSVLRQQLTYHLKSAFPEKYHTDIESCILGSSSAAPVPLNDWLDSMRDVTRIANSVVVNLTQLLGEVDINDFICIEVLRCKYPLVYEILHRKRYLFLGKDSTGSFVSSDQYRYELLKVKEGDDKGKIAFTVYLEAHAEELGIPKDKAKAITDFVEQLFSETFRYVRFQKSQLSISLPANFDRYFSYQLFENNLSENDFIASLALNEEDFNTQLKNWIEKGLEYQVQERLKHLQHFTNREQYEKIIRGIFYMAGLPTGNQHYPMVTGYDGHDLIHKLSDYNHVLSEGIYKNEGGKQAFHDFVYNIFQSAKSPYHFEADFIRLVFKEFDLSAFALSKEELRSFSLGYLENYCKETKTFNIVAIWLLWNTEEINYVSTGLNAYQGHKEIPQEARDVFITYAKKFIDDFLLWTVSKKPFEKERYAIGYETLLIFLNWERFEEMLYHEDIEGVSKYAEEYQRFYEVFKTTGYKEFVHFDFTIIPVKEKFMDIENQ